MSAERYRAARASISVVVRADIFPYESTNPEAPGTVHWVYDDESGTLYCSRAAFDRLARLPDEQKDRLLLAMGATGI